MIEYYEQDDRAGSFQTSERINRHRRSHDIDIKPCKDYLFKVSFNSCWCSWSRQGVSGSGLRGLARYKT